MTRLSTCRGCGRTILWITSRTGRAQPCDPEPRRYCRSRSGPARIVTPDGDVVRAALDVLPGLEDGFGYVSHFATCPSADDFRRR